MCCQWAVRRQPLGGQGRAIVMCKVLSLGNEKRYCQEVEDRSMWRGHLFRQGARNVFPLVTLLGSTPSTHGCLPIYNICGHFTLPVIKKLKTTSKFVLDNSPAPLQPSRAFTRPQRMPGLLSYRKLSSAFPFLISLTAI